MNLDEVLRELLLWQNPHTSVEDKIKYGKQQIQELMQQQNRLTKEEFRDILCEFPPSIAEDSQQPEWTQGEIDKVWDFITKKNKYVLTEEKKLEEMKEQNSKLELDACLKGARIEAERADKFQEKNSELKDANNRLADEVLRLGGQVDGEL